MAIRIPDGYVFVKKAPGVAAELLAAAAEIGADSVIGVRSITGGYHVTQEIAEQYQSGFDEVVEDGELPEGVGETPGADGQVDAAVDETVDAEGEVVDPSEGAEPEEEVDSSEEVEPEEEADTPPLPDESWTVAQIEEWASQQNPPVIFPAEATKKADKLAFISPSAE